MKRMEAHFFPKAEELLLIHLGRVLLLADLFSTCEMLDSAVKTLNEKPVKTRKDTAKNSISFAVQATPCTLVGGMMDGVCGWFLGRPPTP